ncbi:uncharacterized protein LOC109792340 [Cajanus cajan]|uniref:uncharacterized protein LOC109792340 n=1 Tax=Cajanus cajan TaxID=3821 RepID=UPI00098DC282|nr:uncharacterized protein LOC109792340 [Cajanus cajan]
MSITSWNCRGIGHKRAIPILWDLTRSYKPDILFLSETMVNSNRIKDLCHILNFNHWYVVDRSGRGGGLALLWKDTFDITITQANPNYINVNVKDRNNIHWRLTGFYGYPERRKRKDSWDLLRHLASLSNLPWCIIGDFNDLLSSNDKKGTNPHPYYLIQGFRQATMDCGLEDLPLIGHPFTWIKGNLPNNLVEERLDRALATKDWHHLFANFLLSNGVAGKSDHSPITLKLQANLSNPLHKYFRFENIWLEDPDIERAVKYGWGYHNKEGVENKINSCKKYLRIWSRRKHVNLCKSIDILKLEMEKCRNAQGTTEWGLYFQLQHQLSH